MTPLHIAAANGGALVCMFLVFHGAQSAVADAAGLTALHHGIIAGSLPVVHVLLGLGADPVAASPAGTAKEFYRI